MIKDIDFPANVSCRCCRREIVDGELVSLHEYPLHARCVVVEWHKKATTPPPVKAKAIRDAKRAQEARALSTPESRAAACIERAARKARFEAARA